MQRCYIAAVTIKKINVAKAMAIQRAYYIHQYRQQRAGPQRDGPRETQVMVGLSD